MCPGRPYMLGGGTSLQLALPPSAVLARQPPWRQDRYLRCGDGPNSVPVRQCSSGGTPRYTFDVRLAGTC